LYCIVLYCIVLYCIVLYCIVLYCIVLYGMVWYCIVLYCIVLYRIVLYCIVLYCIILYSIVFYFIVLYCIVLYYIVLYCIVLYCIVLYCIVLYCIVLYCIVLYCIVLYCIELCCIVLYCIVSYCILQPNAINILINFSCFYPSKINLSDNPTIQFIKKDYITFPLKLFLQSYNGSKGFDVWDSLCNSPKIQEQEGWYLAELLFTYKCLVILIYYRLGQNLFIINKYAVRSRYSSWPIQLVKD